MFRYPLCDVAINPSDPGEIPARTELASTANPSATGSDGKLLESVAAAAMCIASHRSPDEFGCPPFVFLENVVCLCCPFLFVCLFLFFLNDGIS